MDQEEGTAKWMLQRQEEASWIRMCGEQGSLEVVLGHVGVLKGCGERSRFRLESSCAHRRVQAHTPHPQAWRSAALLAAATGDGLISGISKESAGDRRSCDEGEKMKMEGKGGG